MDMRHGRVAGLVNEARGPPEATIEKTPIAINSTEVGCVGGADGGMRFSLHTWPLASVGAYRRSSSTQTLEGISKDLLKGFVGGAAQVRSSLLWL